MSSTDVIPKQGVRWGSPWGSPWELSPENLFRIITTLQRKLSDLEAEQRANNERRQISPKLSAPAAAVLRRLPGRSPHVREQAAREIVAYLSRNPDRIERVAKGDPQAIGHEKNAHHDFQCSRSTLRSAREAVGAAIRLAKQGISEGEFAELRDEDVAKRCEIPLRVVRLVRAIYPDVFRLPGV
jgi:hypothetical protein